MSALLLYLAVAMLLLGLAHRRVRTTTLAAAIVLTLLPFAFTGRALLTGKIYAPIDLPYQSEPLASVGQELGLPKIHNATLSDVYDQEIPWRKALRYAVAHHEWPLWNPFSLCGDVLGAAAQPAVYYPFNLIALLIPLGASLTFSAAIAFFLFGLCAFLYLRELGLREWTSLVGAAGWMYCSYLVFYLEWPLGPAAGLLPLVFLGVRRVVREPSVRSAALLGVAFTLLLLAGHPETAMHVVALGAAYGLWEWLTFRPLRLRSVGAAVAAGVVALLVCAVYLLPLFDALPQTMEARDRADLFRRNHISADGPTIRARLAADLWPFANGNAWEGEMSKLWAPEKGYVGSILFGPALFALWRGRRRERFFFLGLLLFGLLAGAEAPPVSVLLKKLPLFDIALNQRLVFGASFALAVLAAMGLEEWLERRDNSQHDDSQQGRRDDWRMAACFAVAFAVVALAIAGTWYPLRWLLYTRETLIAHALLALLPIVLGALLFALRLQPRVVIPLLLGLLLAQRVAEDGATYPTLDQKFFYPPIRAFDAIRRDQGPFRVTGQWHLFIPNSSTMYELEDPRGYEAMTLLPFASTYVLWSSFQPVWFNRVDDIERPFLAALNVRYAIVPEAVVPPAGWHRLSAQPGMQLFENERVLGRFFVPRHVRIGRPFNDTIADMADEHDFGNRAWIAGPKGDGRDQENGRGVVTTRMHGSRYEVHASMTQGGWLVASVSGWKGWRATIDGKRAELRNANIAFLALNVPTGDHTIELVYRPTSFIVGRAITLTTLALLLIVALIRRRRFPGSR